MSSGAIGKSPALLLLTFPAACTGNQSTLDAAGEEAASVYTLLVTMVIGAAIVWLLVVGLMIYAMRAHRKVYADSNGRKLILWGGAVFPSVVLLLLLGYALWLMPNARPWFSANTRQARIEVTGEQFWWRIRYLDGDGRLLFETANEIRMPVDTRTTFSLLARDVIHSFWLPSLGGKMDMIPGRTNSLSLKPFRTGLYRGPCAEFCGTSHALMAVTAVVLPQADYDAWIGKRRLPETVPSAGLALFVRHGCPACHAIDGTIAKGEIGPNLTALGERAAIGAGALVNTPEAIARFIRNPAAVKPGALMPAFGMLPDGDIEAIATWLGGLK